LEALAAPEVLVVLADREDPVELAVLQDPEALVAQVDREDPEAQEVVAAGLLVCGRDQLLAAVEPDLLPALVAQEWMVIGLLALQVVAPRKADPQPQYILLECQEELQDHCILEALRLLHGQVLEDH
jgi:hypothetical protein